MSLGDIAIGMGLVLIVLPFLFSAAKESGRMRLPQKSRSFRREEPQVH